MRDVKTMREFVVISSSLLSICLCVINGQHQCPVGTYLDKGTGNCDSCDDICQSADVQGTLEDCRINCPGYDGTIQPDSHTQPCPPGQYFDQVLSHCDFCATICNGHEAQKTTQDCEKNCPDYKDVRAEREETISKEVETEEDAVTSSPGVIAALTVTCVAVITVVIVGVLALFHNKLRIPCLRQGHKRPEPCTEENPLTASASSSEGHISIEETQAHVEEGFTDLSSPREFSTSTNDT